MRQIETNAICKKDCGNGVIEFVINTKDRWVNYKIDNYSEDNYITLTIYNDETYSNPDSIEQYMIPFDNADKYLVYSQQEKDQIYFMAVSTNLLKNGSFEFVNIINK